MATSLQLAIAVAIVILGHRWCWNFPSARIIRPVEGQIRLPGTYEDLLNEKGNNDSDTDGDGDIVMLDYQHQEHTVDNMDVRRFLHS